jgi:hypothetical protein
MIHWAKTNSLFRTWLDTPLVVIKIPADPPRLRHHLDKKISITGVMRGEARAGKGCSGKSRCRV